ncbi:MAG: hypothetical protein ING31_07965 [Burkholderiales bacterium]|nr:hypothetical protein [Burkholderiales bacterium]
MQHFLACLLLTAVCLGLYPLAVDARPYLDLRVTTQRWTPLLPVDTPIVELNDDDILSESFDKAAQNAAAKLKNSLVAALSRGDLLAKNVTLYNVKLDLKKPYLRVGAFEGAGTKANQLRTNLTATFENIGMNPAPVDCIIRPRTGDIHGTPPQLSPRQMTTPAGPML